jgi:hypothetical protein
MTEKTEDTLPPGLEAEFDMLLAKAGMSVPEDRRPGILVGYADLRRQAELLRAQRPPFNEPANVFDLTHIMRGR